MHCSLGTGGRELTSFSLGGELNLAADLLDSGDAPDLLDLQVALLEVPHLLQALPGVHPAGLGLEPQQVPGQAPWETSDRSCQCHMSRQVMSYILATTPTWHQQSCPVRSCSSHLRWHLGVVVVSYQPPNCTNAQMGNGGFWTRALKICPHTWSHPDPAGQGPTSPLQGRGPSTPPPRQARAGLVKPGNSL